MVKHESDHQAADAAVAVQERVNRFELNVSQRGLDQGWIRRMLVVNEPLEISHAVLDPMRRRRNKMGIARPGPTEPVLTPAKFARRLFAAAAFRKQNGMHLPDKPVR